MKGVLSWLVRRACPVGRDYCSTLVALIGSKYKNIFFLAVHFFNSFIPIVQTAGQTAVVGRLSHSVGSLVSTTTWVFRETKSHGGALKERKNERKILLITYDKQ